MFKTRTVELLHRYAYRTLRCWSRAGTGGPGGRRSRPSRAPIRCTDSSPWRAGRRRRRTGSTGSWAGESPRPRWYLSWLVTAGAPSPWATRCCPVRYKHNHRSTTKLCRRKTFTACVRSISPIHFSFVSYFMIFPLANCSPSAICFGSILLLLFLFYCLLNDKKPKIIIKATQLQTVHTPTN